MKVAAPECHKAPVSKLTEDLGPKASYALSSIINDAHLTHVIADAIDVSYQPHALCNVVSKTPEVDDIAASAQIGRAFDQRWSKSAVVEPIGQRWTCNADARNQDRFVCHWDVLSTYVTPTINVNDSGWLRALVNHIGR